MIEKTYKIPEGSEEIIDALVKTGIDRFYRREMDTPVDSKPEFKTAVDSAMVANNWDKRFDIRVADVIDEEIDIVK